MSGAARRAAVALASVSALIGAVSAAAQDASRRDESVAAFTRVAAVFQGPRCINCHTVTDFPRQGDDRHRHLTNVRRGADGHGITPMRCSTCHQRANQSASGVPGADEDWHLAPLSMGWEGLTAAELCRHLQDPAFNGGRSHAAVIDHLSTNLVRWAWAPGTNHDGKPRTLPPLGYEEFVKEAHHWVDTGAACPAP